MRLLRQSVGSILSTSWQAHNKLAVQSGPFDTLRRFTLGPETLARRSWHKDKNDHVHQVPKRLSVLT
jgi:hypothetical protein